MLAKQKSNNRRRSIFSLNSSPKMNEEIQKNDKSDFRNVELIEKNMTEKEQ